MHPAGYSGSVVFSSSSSVSQSEEAEEAGAEVFWMISSGLSIPADLPKGTASPPSTEEAEEAGAEVFLMISGLEAEASSTEEAEEVRRFGHAEASFSFFLSERDWI